jgi:transposase
MIIPSGAVRVLVAMRPVDFRKGMDGLAAVVRESLGSDPYSGVIYVFRAFAVGRNRSRRRRVLLPITQSPYKSSLFCCGS